MLGPGRDGNGNPLAVITQKAVDWWNNQGSSEEGIKTTLGGVGTHAADSRLPAQHSRI